MLEIAVAVAILVGLIGVVVPILPGLLLVAGAIGAWAVVEGAWWLLAAVVLIAGVALLLKIAIPARTARSSASVWAVATGSVAALIGFFIVPVLGMVVGFLLGVLIAELVRLRDARTAWAATWATMRSIGVTIAVEIAAVILLAGMWTLALLV